MHFRLQSLRGGGGGEVVHEEAPRVGRPALRARPHRRLQQLEGAGAAQPGVVLLRADLRLPRVVAVEDGLPRLRRA